MKTKIIFKPVVLIVALCLFGCAAYKTINMMALNLGMSKSEVVNALKRPPDNLIGAKRINGKTLEVLQFTQYDLYNYPVQQYWLYFVNDTLKQWGRPGDWEKESDMIIETRER